MHSCSNELTYTASMKMFLINESEKVINLYLEDLKTSNIQNTNKVSLAVLLRKEMIYMYNYDYDKVTVCGI